MAKKEKRISRLRQNTKCVRFEEIHTLLTSYGFTCRMQGSHAIYSLPGFPPITIPFRKPFLLPVYGRQVLELIEQLALNDEDINDEQS